MNDPIRRHAAELPSEMSDVFHFEYQWEEGGSYSVILNNPLQKLSQLTVAGSHDIQDKNHHKVDD